MNCSKALSILSFFGALAIGVAAAYVVNFSSMVTCEIGPERYLAPITEEAPVRVEPKDLVGRWRGTWGYDNPECMIYIDSVDGNKFRGTLTMQGALVALEGTLDADAREITIRETKVLTMDQSLGRWSLGKDSGVFSFDGRTISGIGEDEYGTYEWTITKGPVFELYD